MVVRIGVDFGTTFTKVAIRAGVDLVPVDWSAITGDESPIGRYLIPGFVSRSPDGEYCWRKLTESKVEGNLKLPVIAAVETGECPKAAVAYLALVIRYARAFLYRDSEIGRKLMTRSLRWELNVGCPTEPHEDPKIVAQFQRIAEVAWQLAAMEQLRETDITAAWTTQESNSGLEADPGVVPEFVAQIAGYLGSSQANEGLHALIDVGGATLDVATFNVVMKDNSIDLPEVPIFFSAVRQLGTHFLQHNRHSHFELELEWDDAVPVESAICFAERNGIRQHEVDAVDDDFLKRVEKCLMGVIDSTRTNLRGDPNSRAWTEGLPVFITGGGSNCELYSHAREKIEAELRKRLNSNRFRFIELDPLGARGVNFGAEIGNRLTVAIGLTEDAENIARVVPHRDIAPLSRTKKERKDHSDLYED